MCIFPQLHSRWYEFYKLQRFIELGYRSTRILLQPFISHSRNHPKASIHSWYFTHPVWGKRSADEAVPCKTKLFDPLSVAKFFPTEHTTAGS